MSDRRAMLILIGAWLAIAAAVGAGPEIALDDSWNYAQMTEHLLERGALRFSHYDSALVVLHVLWGALVTAVTGFSLSHVVVANLLAALLALVAGYFLARQFDLSPEAALWVTAATGATPPFFVLAYTYMADFWFLIPAWLSLAFMARFLRRGKELDAAFAGLFAAAAFWNRLHAVLLVAAFVVFLLWQQRRLTLRARTAFYVVGLPAVSWLALHWATPALQPVRTTFSRKSSEVWTRLLSPDVLALDSLERLAIVLLSIGAYALPVVLMLAARRASNGRGPAMWAGAAAAVAAAGAALWLTGEAFPFDSSVLREQPPATAAWFVMPWTLAALAGAAGWLFLLIRRREAEGAPLLDRFLVVAMIVLIAALLPLVYFMDRYFLVFVPLVMILAVRRAGPWSETPRWAKVAAGVVLALFVASGAMRVTHYRAGIAAQWNAADRLVTQGVSSLEIDGGYSWTGWRNFAVCREHRGENNTTSLDTHYVVEICPMMKTRFDVVFHEMDPPRRLVSKDDWHNFLGDEDTVYVYQRP
ncbi:MAG: glycosyltransferase family 39 protein [Candidatus Lernaella stagnicola]|nr:glycosyltransferase family 39 protein [Candidatus Lernaella stagnicola]